MRRKKLSELGGDSLLSEMEKLEVLGGVGLSELQRVNVGCVIYQSCTTYGQCPNHTGCTVYKECQNFTECP